MNKCFSIDNKNKYFHHPFPSNSIKLNKRDRSLNKYINNKDENKKLTNNKSK